VAVPNHSHLIKFQSMANWLLVFESVIKILQKSAFFALSFGTIGFGSIFFFYILVLGYTKHYVCCVWN